MIRTASSPDCVTPPRRAAARALSCLAAAAVGLLPLAGGCINDDVLLYEVNVTGLASAPSPPAATGTLHLEFHHQVRAGRDALAHPLGLIAERTRPPGSLPIAFDETLLYPTASGDGLVVYGWLDLDGDGILCAPGQTSEPSGILAVPDFPRHQLDAPLSLSSLCAGPERLYP
jgi:hypothetical protein